MKLVGEHYFPLKTKSAGFFGKLFGKGVGVAEPEQAGTGPVYLVVMTDGDNSDEGVAEDLVSDMAGNDIYIQFVGIGTGSKFKFIRRLADEYGHVGFVDFSNPSAVTDEQMFDELLNEEFLNWFAKRSV